MKLSLKRVLKLFTIACAITGTGFGADYGLDVYHQATQREVGLDSDPDFGWPNASNTPLEVLKSAIPKDKLAARFRVKWSDSSPHVEGWLLYDRRQSSLQIDESGCGYGRKPDEIICDESLYEYTNVTDEVLAGLSPSVSLGSLPKTLPMLGCHVHKIKDD